MTEHYVLPDLKYKFNELEPHISKEQLKIHYEKHHSGYVKNANTILDMLKMAREKNTEIDMKSTLRELAFYIGGHVLHSVFWESISPQGGGEPEGNLADAIMEEFGGFERFKAEFTQTAASVEGSGWAALTYCKKTGRLMIMQIEKHNVNVYPMFGIILAIDVWEHAYYIDHKNNRAGFIDNFWNIVDWKGISKRFKNVCG